MQLLTVKCLLRLVWYLFSTEPPTCTLIVLRVSTQVKKLLLNIETPFHIIFCISFNPIKLIFFQWVTFPWYSVEIFCINPKQFGAYDSRCPIKSILCLHQCAPKAYSKRSSPMRPHAFLQPLRFKAHQDQVQYKWPTDFMIVVDLQIIFLEKILSPIKDWVLKIRYWWSLPMILNTTINNLYYW